MDEELKPFEEIIKKIELSLPTKGIIKFDEFIEFIKSKKTIEEKVIDTVAEIEKIFKNNGVRELSIDDLDKIKIILKSLDEDSQTNIIAYYVNLAKQNVKKTQKIRKDCEKNKTKGIELTRNESDKMHDIIINGYNSINKANFIIDTLHNNKFNFVMTELSNKNLGEKYGVIKDADGVKKKKSLKRKSLKRRKSLKK